MPDLRERRRHNPDPGGYRHVRDAGGELIEHDIELYVQNLSDTAYIYIGDSSVTSSSFGMRLGPNDSMTFDYRGYDNRPTFYGIASANSTPISVFRIQR